ncbi:MAG: hypothetical protein H6733_10580 [Alphaproteobacteria bacterium]|nr:hypothetical protein [Alphaproteobacteria bacterium]
MVTVTDTTMAWGSAGLAAAAALLQVALHARIDLGPLVLALVAGAILLVPAPPLGVHAVLAGAVIVAALGWWAAARRGVGRPELTGTVLAIAAVVFAGVPVVAQATGLDPVRVRLAGVAPILFLGLVSVLLARERRGLVGQRIWHHREVPVGGRTAPEPAPGPADAASGAGTPPRAG